MADRKKDRYSVYIIFIMTVLALCLRLAFVTGSSISDFQHDIRTLGEGQGHLGYIEYLLENGHLPDFDPRLRDQFYHPPLLHIISALWVKLNLSFNVGYGQAFENLQILSFIISGLTMVTALDLFARLKLKGTGLLCAYGLVCFHPTFIIFSGYINNDPLCLLLMLLSLTLTLRWDEKPTLLRIIPPALAVALGVLTKSSGLIIAPAMAFIFIRKFFREKKLRNDLFLQFALFGIIAIPLGCSWMVYNRISYGVPLNFVPDIGADSWLYVGNHSASERLDVLRAILPESVFLRLEGYNCEYNIPTAVLKTSLFGEYKMNMSEALCRGMYYANMALILLAAVKAVLKYAKAPSFEDAVMLIVWASFFASFVSFCFKYPYACTMDIRYIVPCIFAGAYALGTGKRQAISAIFTGIFCALSFFTYIMLYI